MRGIENEIDAHLADVEDAEQRYEAFVNWRDENTSIEAEQAIEYLMGTRVFISSPSEIADGCFGYKQVSIDLEREFSQHMFEYWAENVENKE